MKRIIKIVLTLAMLLSLTSNTFAIEKGIERLDRDKQIFNKDESFKIDYLNQPARVFYGSNGIDILYQDGSKHIDTNFAVEKLCVIEDLNKDGFCEFATYQTCENGDNFFIISSKDGSTLFSTNFTRPAYDNQFGIHKKNTSILKMLAHKDKLFIVSDYDLYCLDLNSFTFNFKHSALDNIWDIEIVDDKIAFIDQLSQVGFIDINSGKLLHQENIVEKYEVEAPYDLGKFEVYGNLWDLFFYKDHLYITSEDGYLYDYDYDNYEYQKYGLSQNGLDYFKETASYNYNIVLNHCVYIPNGINNDSYKNYRICDSYENYLLIAAYIKDVDGLADIYNDYSCYILYDLSTNNANVLENESYNGRSQACFVKDKEKAYIYLLTVASNGYSYFSKYDLDGKKLETKQTQALYLESDNLNNYKISDDDNKILVELFNGGCCYSDLEYQLIDYLYVLKTKEYLASSDDTIILAENENGRIIKLIAYNKNLSQEKWSCDLTYKNSNGFKLANIADFNNDGYQDIIGYINVSDGLYNIIKSIFVVIDGRNGQYIKQDSIVLYSYYNEKGKQENVYLLADEMRCLADYNNDGYCELLINGSYIVNGKKMKIAGMNEGFGNYNGKVINVSDGNHDGFDDYVVVSDDKAVLYISKISGFNVGYKAQKSISLDAKQFSSKYCGYIGDVDRDGYGDIALPNVNSKGYQVFDVYSSLTLEKILTLCPNGVSYREQYISLDKDLNGDGYNEIYGYTNEKYCYVILSGKDGATLKTLSPDYGDDEAYEDYEIFHPDYPITINESDYMECQIFFVNDDKQFVMNKNYYDDDTWEYVCSLAFYDCKTLEKIDEYVVENNYNKYTICEVDGNDDLMILNDDQMVALFDLKTRDTIAKYNVSGKNYHYIDDEHILLADYNNVAYLINCQKGFEVLTEIPSVTTDYILNIKLKPLVDFSTFNIYDNDDLVASGSEKDYEIKLVEGKHKIVIEMDDASGKVSNIKYQVELQHQSNKTFYLIIVAIVVLAGSILAGKYRKIYIKKHAKEAK